MSSSFSRKYNCKKMQENYFIGSPPTVIGQARKRQASHSEEELSEYEKQIQQNVAEREALLEKMNFNEIKASLKIPNVPQKRKFIPKCYEAERRQPSLRLQNLSPSGNPVPVKPKNDVMTMSQASASVDNVAPIRKSIGPLRLKSTLLGLHEKPDFMTACSFIDEICSLEAYGSSEAYSSENCSLERFLSWVGAANLTESTGCKVVHGKIGCLAIHPSEEKIIICAGAAAGELAIVNLSSEEINKQHLLLLPHSLMIQKLSFCPHNPERLYSSSKDGTVLCADFQYRVFKKIFATIDVPEIKYFPTMFDFIDPNTIGVTHGQGFLSVTDHRQRLSKCVTYEKLHSDYINSVNVHPIKQNYIMTTGAERDHLVAVWDLRYLQKKSQCISKLSWGTAIYSACFSHLTGNSILLTGRNDIGILDSSSCETTLECKLKIPHCNTGGRWLSNFKAVWHPQREDAYVVGSWEYPRRIELRGISDSLLHTFSDNLSCICSICVFHSSLPILVGANSSGKIFVYK